MIALYLLSMASPLKPPALFDAAIAARAHLRAYTAHIETDTLVQGKRERRTYDAAYDGSILSVRVRQPATATIERSDRTYELLDDRLVAYDTIANERLQRPGSSRGSITTRLAAVLGTLDEPLLMALDPVAMKAFLAKYRSGASWKVRKVNGEIAIARLAGGTRSELRFGASSSYLQSVAVTLKGSNLHWSFSFRPGARVALNIPSDARRVSEFSERPAPPKFASREAEAVVGRMMKAYQNLRQGEIQVEDDGAVSHLWLNGIKVREDRPGFEWAYDGSTLTAVNKRANQFYEGKTIRVTLSEYIVRMGGEVDPMIRRMLAHRPPFGELFPPEAIVSLHGSISVGGVADDVVKVASASTNLSLFVRTDNHLLDSVEAEVLDRSKHDLMSNTRRYKYLSLDEAIPSDRFTIDAGTAKKMPFPVIQIVK